MCCWLAESTSSLAEDTAVGPLERLRRSPASSEGAGTGAATDPWGKRGFMRVKKNVDYCLGSITDKNDKNISRVNKGCFDCMENVI